MIDYSHRRIDFSSKVEFNIDSYFVVVVIVGTLDHESKTSCNRRVVDRCILSVTCEGATFDIIDVGRVLQAI